MTDQTRRVLVFGSYEAKIEIDDQDEASFEKIRPWSRYFCLRKALEFPANTSGEREQRKRLKEITRRFKKIAEWYEESVKIAQNGVVKTELKKDWRLIPGGEKVISLVQAELDLLRKCWDQFTQEAGMNIEFSTDVDDFLENVPEWEKEKADMAVASNPKASET